jgi:hypothetical protein
VSVLASEFQGGADRKAKLNTRERSAGAGIRSLQRPVDEVLFSFLSDQVRQMSLNGSGDIAV